MGRVLRQGPQLPWAATSQRLQQDVPHPMVSPDDPASHATLAEATADDVLTRRPGVARYHYTSTGGSSCLATWSRLGPQGPPQYQAGGALRGGLRSAAAYNTALWPPLRRGGGATRLSAELFAITT